MRVVRTIGSLDFVFQDLMSGEGFYVPPTEGGGHIVFGANPVGVRVGVRVRVASFIRLSFEPVDGF